MLEDSERKNEKIKTAETRLLKMDAGYKMTDYRRNKERKRRTGNNKCR
jgi:hypothetical protein